MKLVKICAQVLLVLGTMRAGNWALGWMLTKLAGMSTSRSAIASHVAGLLVFVLLLYWDLSPGEPMNLAAAL